MWRRQIPNILTALRVLIAPLVAMLIWQDLADVWRWTALLLFIFAAVSDGLDGYLARRWESVTAFGRMLDPIADKLLVVAVILALATDPQTNWLYMVPSLVILFREFLVAGLREFLAGAEITMPVTQLAKWKTAIQMVALGLLIAAPVAHQLLSDMTFLREAGIAMLWIAALMTAWTGGQYFHAARGYL